MNIGKEICEKYTLKLGCEIPDYKPIKIEKTKSGAIRNVNFHGLKIRNHPSTYLATDNAKIFQVEEIVEQKIIAFEIAYEWSELLLAYKVLTKSNSLTELEFASVRLVGTLNKFGEEEYILFEELIS